MKPKFQYVLAILIIIAVYELYLIVFYKYRDFQTNAYISRMNEDNAKISLGIEKKKEYLAYVRTNAYLDRAAKSSQNRKNPGEEAVFFVDQEEVKDYRRVDIDKTIVSEVRLPSPTAGMSNREKWFRLVLKIDVRE